MKNLKWFKEYSKTAKYLPKTNKTKQQLLFRLGLISLLFIGIAYFGVSSLAFRSTGTTAWTNTNATVATGTITGGPTATVTLAPSSAGSLIYNSPPATSTIAGRGGAATMFTPNVATTTSTISISPVVTGCTLGANQVCQRGTITIQFNQPVTNPVLHLTGLGGNGSSSDFSAQMTLTGSSPAGATLGSVSAGAVNLQVASGNTIRVINNNGVTSCGSGTSGAGCGSVQINGTVTSLTFNSSLLFANGSGVTSGTSRETYDITVTAQEDFSDAPTTNFNSSQAPTHVISDLKLGSTIDEDNATTADSTTSPFPVAAGANNNGTNGDGADEDAISTFPTLTTTSTSYSLTVPISGASKAGIVCGWIDFDRNNTFVATERACANFAAGDTSVVLNWNSANSNAPTGLTTGNNYVRLRAGYTTAQIQTADSKGRADSGEVEDYQIPITVATPDLTITKSHVGNFTRGSIGTYTITVSNIGAGSSSGTITVTDTLPTGLSVADGALTLGGTNSANWSCSAASNVITCTSSTAIAASGSSVFTFNVNVAANAQTSVTNTATVSGGGQTNTTNDSSSDVTSIPQTSFGTCDSRMFLSQAPNAFTNTTLYNIDTTANPFTFPAIAQGSTGYNAIGFNPNDFYIYAMENFANSSNHLIRIGSDGSTIDLGAVSGMPVTNYNNGEIGSNGILYVRPGNNTNLMYAINLSTLTATTITTSSSFVAADLAWIGGKLYTITTSNGQLLSIDPSTGLVTNIGSPSGAVQFGALYGAPNGLFANDNAGSGFYQIDLTTGARTLISASPSAGSNDGAHCVDANITFGADIAVTKDDGKTSYTAGGTNVYTITATNNGPFGAQNVTVSDPLPSGITTASWTCAGANGGVCAASGTGAINDSTVDLPVGASVTYTMTMTIPSGFTGNLTNTVTATVGSSNTDPTPGNNSASDTDTATTYSISGKVFEDVNYGGGEGRDLTTAGGVVRPNARVELYNSSGNFITSTLTDAGGLYTFANVSPGSYTVRVVNSTVTSSRSGYVPGLLPVQTFRTDYWGVAPFDVQRVGGENPALVDAGNGSTTLAALTTATTTAQSITTALVTNENVVDIDFGFNFDTIVNTNNSGQGSLRQFILNANALSNTGLAQVGLTAGRDTSIFMISYGVDGFGLRSAFNYFSGGAATITISSSLPTVSDTVTLDGTTQPGYSGAPIIEVSGANMPIGTNNHILNFTASNNVVRRLVINRAGDDAIYAQHGSNGNLFVGNYIGVNVAGTAVVGNSSDGIDVEGNDNTIGGLTADESNIIGGSGSGQSGIEIGGGATASSGTVVIGNYIGTNPSGADLGNGQSGIEVRSATGTTMIGGSSAGAPNVIAYNKEIGIVLYPNGLNVVISRNSIYANTGLGIDINWNGVSLNDANDTDSGPNNILNFPVFENVYIVGGNTTIVGCAPAGATIELFKTDISMGTAAVGDNKLGKLQDYGEGQVYLGTFTEGSGSDTDSGTGCATDIDGNNQTGMSRFSFTFSTPSGVSVGTMLTSTATVSATGTSEFSSDFTIVNGLPNVTLLKSCPSPANCTTAPQNPGTDVTYNIAFTNGGLAGAQNVVITDGIPANTDFKLGTASSSLGTTGLTVVIEYSNDYDALNPTLATWTYTPVSGGGGADAGYDRLVKAVRWRATAGVLSNIAPNNTGSVSFGVKIR